MKEIKNLGIRENGWDKRYNRAHTATFSLFECEFCKNQFEIKRSRGLKQGSCKACRGNLNKSHDMSRTRQYSIWQGMKERCTNPNRNSWDRYGGRGITFDPKWDTFEGFWEDMKDTYTDNLTIDRKDGDKNYCKANCRWITGSENSSDTCRKKQVIQFEKTGDVLNPWKPVKEWDSAKRAADTLGLTASHITSVCLGKRKTHGKSYWTYKN